MKMSKDLTDKLRNALGDEDGFALWTVGAEILAAIMEDEKQPKIFATTPDLLDEYVKKFNEKLKEGNHVTATDIFESLGFDRESAPDVKFETSKKPAKPVYKTYEDLAYISAMETTRCHMLIDKLKATIELLDAQQQYYEAMSAIERDNESFGFDLNI